MAECVLLVEGRDDWNLVGQLMRLFGYVDGSYELRECSGYDRLRAVFSVQLKSSVPGTNGSLGVIVDADADPHARWQSLQAVLEDAGYAAASITPRAEGTFVEGRPVGKPLVGIWMWPDNQTPGMLEDFVAQMIRQPDSTWQHARDCVDAIEHSAATEEEFLFKPVHRSKAYVHTWLAWREQPGRPMGHAVKLKFLDSDAPGAQAFRSWIKRLFDGPVVS